MAIPAQGCVITWTDYLTNESVTVQEVTTLDIQPFVERIGFSSTGETFFLRGGQVTLTGFSNEALHPGKLRNWGTLKITVRSGAQDLVLHEGYAQLTASTIRATVNEAILFAFQLRLWGVFSTTGTFE